MVEWLFFWCQQSTLFSPAESPVEVPSRQDWGWDWDGLGWIDPLQQQSISRPQLGGWRVKLRYDENCGPMLPGGGAAFLRSFTRIASSQPTVYIEQAPLLWTPSAPSEAHAPSQQYYPFLSLNWWDLVSKTKDYIEITWVFASFVQYLRLLPFSFCFAPHGFDAIGVLKHLDTWHE